MVVWSYPKDGDTDIPTNVTLWLLLSNWQRPAKVLLDGQEVPVDAFGFGYRPPAPLAPSSPHELSVQAGTQAPVTLTIRFTTASGETERELPMVPKVQAVTATSSRPLSTLCQSVVHAMDCFDTGQDTHLIFETEVRPFLWIVEKVPMAMGESPVFTLWPGECELPEVFLDSSAARTCSRQYRLHAVEGTGLKASGQPFCPSQLVRALPPDAGDLEPEADGGVAPEQDASPTTGTPTTGNPQNTATPARRRLQRGRSRAGGGLLLLLALALLRRRYR